jgi:hypothetical protein
LLRHIDAITPLLIDISHYSRHYVSSFYLLRAAFAAFLSPDFHDFAPPYAAPLFSMPLLFSLTLTLFADADYATLP